MVMCWRSCVDNNGFSKWRDSSIVTVFVFKSVINCLSISFFLPVDMLISNNTPSANPTFNCSLMALESIPVNRGNDSSLIPLKPANHAAAFSFEISGPDARLFSISMECECLLRIFPAKG